LGLNGGRTNNQRGPAGAGAAMTTNGGEKRTWQAGRSRIAVVSDGTLLLPWRRMQACICGKAGTRGAAPERSWEMDGQNT
jgi:hypothetical protein